MRQAEIANLEIDTVRRTIDDVKQHAPGTPVSLILFVAVGTSDEIGPFRSSFASPFASRALRQRRRRRQQPAEPRRHRARLPHGAPADDRPRPRPRRRPLRVAHQTRVGSSPIRARCERVLTRRVPVDHPPAARPAPASRPGRAPTLRPRSQASATIVAGSSTSVVVTNAASTMHHHGDGDDEDHGAGAGLLADPECPTVMRVNTSRAMALPIEAIAVRSNPTASTMATPR